MQKVSWKLLIMQIIDKPTAYSWTGYLVSVWIDIEVIMEISDVLYFIPTAWSFIGSV